MIIVREVFIAKPGQASKLAKLLKEVMGQSPKYKTTIMTDLTGRFNKVVTETELENLSAVETRYKEYAQNADMRDKMKGYIDMYLTGKREIYQVV